MMLLVLEVICVILIAALAAGSLLNLSRHPHWFVRGWDFPRVQIVATGLFFALFYGALRLFDGRGFGVWVDWLVLGLALFLVVWHAVRIVPFTPMARTQVKRVEAYDARNSIRVVMSNVQMCNRQYDRWLEVVGKTDPDLLLLLEVDQEWLAAIESLGERFPDRVLRPQDNCYGMAMMSRLPMIDYEVRYLITDDVPSIDAIVRLRSDREIRIVGVHPRPPEPVRGENSAERDAELVRYGRVLRDESRPVIIAGDLNDVAWSPTTRLFLKISKLLDPRRGRGFFNTFHAQHPIMRFPLDHVFHSQHFKLLEIRRLGNVGSDHFPMLIELQCNATEQDDQEALHDSREDHREAETIVQRPEASESAELNSTG